MSESYILFVFTAESDVSSILSHSDEDDDMEPDNYNSAGEEIEDEEFDESRVAYTVPPREVEVVGKSNVHWV